MTEETSAEKAARLRIYGKVQGVWFRAWAKQRAEMLGLDGWARNREDGTVEILVTGPAAAVDAMVESCHEGSPFAKVERVTVEPATGIARRGFDIKPTV